MAIEKLSTSARSTSAPLRFSALSSSVVLPLFYMATCWLAIVLLPLYFYSLSFYFCCRSGPVVLLSFYLKKLSFSCRSTSQSCRSAVVLLLLSFWICRSAVVLLDKAVVHCRSTSQSCRSAVVLLPGWRLRILQIIDLVHHACVPTP